MNATRVLSLLHPRLKKKTSDDRGCRFHVLNVFGGIHWGSSGFICRFFKTRFFVRTGDSTCIGDSSSGFTGFTLGVHGIHLGIQGIHFKTWFFVSLGIQQLGIHGNRLGIHYSGIQQLGIHSAVQQLGIQYSRWFNETQSAPTSHTKNS